MTPKVWHPVHHVLTRNKTGSAGNNTLSDESTRYERTPKELVTQRSQTHVRTHKHISRKKKGKTTNVNTKESEGK